MRYLCSLLLLFVCPVLFFPGAAGADPTDPEIYGQTIGTWSADWWNWAVSYDTTETPLVNAGDVDCMTGQPDGKVWFLAGYFSWALETPVVRTCSIRRNKALFFPLVNGVVWAPGDCADEEACRWLAMDYLPTFPRLFCTVDDRPCVFDHQIVRTQSPAFKMEFHEDWQNWGIAPYYDPSIADGYWVMLPPLEPGTHVIHFGAEDGIEGMYQDVTYFLTVE